MLGEANPASAAVWLDAIEVCKRHDVRLEDMHGRLLVVGGRVEATGDPTVVQIVSAPS